MSRCLCQECYFSVIVNNTSRHDIPIHRRPLPSSRPSLVIRSNSSSSPSNTCPPRTSHLSSLSGTHGRKCYRSPHHSLSTHIPLPMSDQMGRRKLSNLSLLPKKRRLRPNPTIPHLQNLRRNRRSLDLSNLRPHRVWSVQRCPRLRSSSPDEPSLRPRTRNSTCMGLCGRRLRAQTHSNEK